MLDKINKLINISKKENDEIYNKLIIIASKIKDKDFYDKKYLLVVIKLLESLISPDKVDVADPLERMEIEV